MSETGHPQIHLQVKQDTMVQIAAEIGQSTTYLNGWEQTPIEFDYNDKNNTGMVVFQKRFTAGEEVDIPQENWTGTLVLLPRLGDANTND